MYVINGATKEDVLTASEVTIQRNGPAVHVQFPAADGTYLTRYSKQVNDQVCSATWLSYAQCDKVERSKVESDTATELS
jgi:hypothetical protein